MPINSFVRVVCSSISLRVVKPIGFSAESPVKKRDERNSPPFLRNYDI
jgi:hypothetical protein